jgi:hypothetical protein
MLMLLNMTVWRLYIKIGFGFCMLYVDCLPLPKMKGLLCMSLNELSDVL